VSPKTFRFPGVESRWLAIKLEFQSIEAPVDGRQTPVLQGFAIRALPATTEVEIVFPVNVSDHMEAPAKKSFTLKGRGEEVYAAMVLLEGKQADVKVLATGETFDGVITKVDTPMQFLARRGSDTLVSNVTFRGKRT